MPPTQPALSNNETLTNFVNDILDVSSIVMKRALQDGCRENQLYMAAAAGIATFTTAVMLGVPKDKALEAAIRTGITVNEAADAAVALSSKTKDAQTRVKKAIDVAATTLGKSAYNNVTGISAPKRGLVKTNVERTVLKETIAPSTKEVRMEGGASPGEQDTSNLAWIFDDNEMHGGVFPWSEDIGSRTEANYTMGNYTMGNYTSGYEFDEPEQYDDGTWYDTAAQFGRNAWDTATQFGRNMYETGVNWGSNAGTATLDFLINSGRKIGDMFGHNRRTVEIDEGVCPADFDEGVCPATDLQDNRGLIRRGVDFLSRPMVQIGVRALARASPYLERMASKWWHDYNLPPEEDIDLQGEVEKKIREQRDKRVYDVGWAQPKEKTVGQIVEEVKREHDVNWANKYIKNAKFRDKVENIVGNTWHIAKNVLIGAAEDAAALKQHEDHLNYLQAIAKTNQGNERLMREIEFQKAHPLLYAFRDARTRWNQRRRGFWPTVGATIAAPARGVSSYLQNDLRADERLLREYKQQPLPQAAVNYGSLFANNSPIPSSIPQTTVRAYPSSIPLSKTMEQSTGNKKVAVEPVQSVSATSGKKNKPLKTKVERESLASPYAQDSSTRTTKKAKSVPVSKRETPSVLWVMPQESKAVRTERKTATKKSKPSALRKGLVRGAKAAAKVGLVAAVKAGVAKGALSAGVGKLLAAAIPGLLTGIPIPA